LLLVPEYRHSHCLFGHEKRGNGYVFGDVSGLMSPEQMKEQISYLETRIERQRAIIEGLETEGYGGEVVRRSRVLLQQMIADLDQLLLHLREATSGEQEIPASAPDPPDYKSIDQSPTSDRGQGPWGYQDKSL
jgi:uncharacterized coiled-coil protein SlyX